MPASSALTGLRTTTPLTTAWPPLEAWLAVPRGVVAIKGGRPCALEAASCCGGAIVSRALHGRRLSPLRCSSGSIPIISRWSRSRCSVARPEARGPWDARSRDHGEAVRVLRAVAELRHAVAARQAAECVAEAGVEWAEAERVERGRLEQQRDRLGDRLGAAAASRRSLAI
eukprot:scaffold57729_cov41-Phaeocystis_antarctica.AAC.2